MVYIRKTVKRSREESLTNKRINDKRYRDKESSKALKRRDTFNKNRCHKTMSTEKLLGVTFEIVKLHISRQFKKGMTWENYGEWHVDHKIPLASAKDEEDLKMLCHYSNLQPLWAKENIEKSDKILPFQVKIAL